LAIQYKQARGDRVLVEPCLVEANGKSLSSSWYFGSECDGGFAQHTVDVFWLHPIGAICFF